jgi:hypothetical protein
MTLDATVRLIWDDGHDQANRFMEDAFNEPNPFALITGECPDTPDDRGDAWGTPFEPMAVTANEPGLVEFVCRFQALIHVVEELAEMAPTANFLMLEMTEAGLMEEPPVPATGYFRTQDGSMAEVNAPAEFNGTTDELWAAMEGATRRYSELSEEGALV